MPRIAGVDIPENKKLKIALRYIHGIGPMYAEAILKEAGLETEARAKTLSEDDVASLNQIIENNYVVEGALRRQVQQNIARLRDIRCYRGDRHRRGQPRDRQEAPRAEEEEQARAVPLPQGQAPAAVKGGNERRDERGERAERRQSVARRDSRAIRTRRRARRRRERGGRLARRAPRARAEAHTG